MRAGKGKGSPLVSGGSASARATAPSATAIPLPIQPYLMVMLVPARDGTCRLTQYWVANHRNPTPPRNLRRRDQRCKNLASLAVFHRGAPLIGWNWAANRDSPIHPQTVRIHAIDDVIPPYSHTLPRPAHSAATLPRPPAPRSPPAETRAGRAGQTRHQ